MRASSGSTGSQWAAVRCWRFGGVTAHDTKDEGVTIGPVLGLWIGVLYSDGAHGNIWVVDRSTASVADFRGVGILLLAGGALEHRVVGARGD